MFYILFFILGAVFGSFLDCLIYRINEEKSILNRSYCLNCKKTLGILDLIPVFSYIVLLGKCRYCKSKIQFENFFVEVILGILFSFGYWFFFVSGLWLHGQLIISFIFYLILVFILSFIFIYDLKYYLIVDFIVYLGIVLSIIFNLIMKNNILNIFYGIVLGVIFFGIQYVISKGKWLGSGDILLGVFMGALLGFKITIVALLITYFSGAIIGIFLLLSKSKKEKTKLKIPLGPFISFAMFISFLFGEQLLNWYINLLII
ncbi:MAG TPA: prepilin peptidase [bacterium]|jgi:prepilin signal peptidase PulO-like enzyme (type II secretory pathway)|nr:prepilin peptidase [bacterium]HOG37971.1 prepilin peptidase [bacterium]HQI03030.1 prepilin peptidase [bacterium]